MIEQNLKKRIFTSLILFFLIFLSLNHNFFLVYLLIVFGVFSFVEFSNLIKKAIKNNYFYIFILILFSIYIFILFIITFVFFTNFFSKIIFLIVLFSCIFSDIGGFIFGKTFKGPKLTKISPNKTISGAIGSIFLSSIFMSSAFLYLSKNFEIMIFFIGVMTSIGCQLGDLFFSYLKRKAKVKDTGKFLPGHGGVLDRLDGILLGLPIGLTILLMI